MKVSEVFKHIQKTSDGAGVASYLVGGYVRDLFLDKEFKKDIDIVVEGSGLAFAKALDKRLKEVGRLIEFPDFDTARYLVPLTDIPVGDPGAEVLELEFAGARAETYDRTSRKPKVVSATLEQDLSRRDFTVNAMALPIELFTKAKAPTKAQLQKAVIDPYNGQADLKEKCLRTPLNPDVTFSDDPLRMMRAVRFAAQLGFTIEPKTLEAVHTNRERIKIISAERVQEELLKLLGTKEPSIGLILMFQTHLMDLVLPEVSNLDGVEDVYGHQHKNNLVHSFKVVDNIAVRSDKIWLRLAGLLHDIGKPGTKKFVAKVGWTFHGHEHLGKKMLFAIAKRLKFSKDLTNYLATLIRWHLQPISLMDDGITDSAVRRLIVTLKENIHDLLILGQSDITTGNPNKKEHRLKNYVHLEKRVQEVIEIDKMLAFHSPVRGEEIMKECNLKPGPTVGKIKEAIEEAILDGIIPNEYEPARKYFEKIKDQYLKDVKDWERSS